jgi:anthranilate synthase component 2
MKLALIDNYDSFTYNLVHYLESMLEENVDVIPNDDQRLDDLSMYDAMVLSPGPGLPEASGRLMDVIKRYAATQKILGVCLGHQALALHFGAKLENLDQVKHGESTPIHLLEENDQLYQGIKFPMQVGRYHSWVVSKHGLPDCLSVTTVDDFGNIMSFRHKSLNIQAVQYHPESILTPNGKEILRNWLFG